MSENLTETTTTPEAAPGPVVETPTAAAPSPVPAAKGDDGKEPTEADYAALATYEDPGEVEDPAPAPAAAPSVTPVKPVEAPPVAAQPAPAVAAPPAPAAAPAPAPAAAPAPASEPVIDEKKIAELRESTLKQLEPFYEMTDQEEELFNTDPKAYFKRAGAQLQLATYEMTFNALRSVLPGMVRELTQRDTTYSKLEEQFFGMYADLKPHADHVVQMAQWVKQTQPKLTTEERMKVVGRMVRAQLGLAEPATKPATPTPSPSPSPVQPGARRVVSQEPYAPAQPGASATVKAPSNPWQELAEFDDPGEE